MSEVRDKKIDIKWIGVVAVLFGILLLANHGNELLKQLVITPLSAAELGIPADCRADELEEENISLLECRLMVANVQITLASSPDWFRPVMLLLASLGSLFAVLSVYVGISLFSHSKTKPLLVKICFGALLSTDLLMFIAASNTGPLLRAHYLSSILLWLFVHATLFSAVIVGLNREPKGID
ncbi:MAG: hypothetical protein CMQ41_08825 [Gammaproteobacteria bacterium]|nr:hypothetical protein [Gammaproteobacteria bacterium]|tara:strand:+ start:583 stop:1128 length:546 start_codon:yes stop_codon:yes gene_type:complete